MSTTTHRIHDHALAITIAGSGSPSVVFDSGCGGDSSNWSHLLPRACELATACAYDRAGAGRSERGTCPRDAEHMVEDLRELLQAATVPSPYVLVGLSLGGLVARLFAYLHPDEVGGLVLVESAHEETPQRLPLKYWEKEKASLARLRGIAREEAEMIEPSGEQLRRARHHLGATPIVVLTGGKKWSNVTEGVTAEEVDAAWLSLQADLARDSSRGEHWIDPNSGHNLHVDNPDLVLRAIEHVLTQSCIKHAVRRTARVQQEKQR